MPYPYLSFRDNANLKHFYRTSVPYNIGIGTGKNESMVMAAGTMMVFQWIDSDSSLQYTPKSDTS